MRAKKRFGQNFLTDNKLLEDLANLINVAPNDKLLEIGPGKGDLTKNLINVCYSYFGIELDRDLLVFLRNKFPKNKNAFIDGDILKLSPSKIYASNEFRVVGNIPYNISSQIIFKFLTKKWDTMILMVQKELANRIISNEGSKEYGRISVMVQNFCKVEYACDISKNVFHPKPKVDSGILKFKRINTSINLEKFSFFIKEAFKQRRKKLKNNLKNICDYKLIKEYAEKRPEEISPKTYLILFNKIYF